MLTLQLTGAQLHLLLVTPLLLLHSDNIAVTYGTQSNGSYCQCKTGTTFKLVISAFLLLS